MRVPIAGSRTVQEAVSRPPRVLYSFPLRVGLPGIGNTAWQQVAGLTQIGVPVTLCCGSLEKPIPGLHRVVETMRVGPVAIPYRVLGDDRAFLFHDWRVGRELARHSYDVFHGWPGGSLRSLGVARRLGVRSFLERPNTHTAFAYAEVAREHEILGLPVDPSHTHAFKSARLAHEEREYALADKLLCPSDFVARTFLERGFAPAQIARHQYGYSPDRITASTRDADAPFTVAFVGRCEPRKGLHYALKAWHQSGAAETGKFLICGQYVPGYRELLEPMLRHPSVEEIGFTSDVGAVFARADALVLPSIEEGSALVTYEARGAGCVVLASDVAGALGTHGQDLLLHPARDSDMLSRQLGELSRDRLKLTALRSQGSQSVERLTWSSAARTLLNRYREGNRADG